MGDSVSARLRVCIFSGRLGVIQVHAGCLHVRLHGSVLCIAPAVQYLLARLAQHVCIGLAASICPAALARHALRLGQKCMIVPDSLLDDVLLAELCEGAAGRLHPLSKIDHTALVLTEAHAHRGAIAG